MMNVAKEQNERRFSWSSLSFLLQNIVATVKYV